MKREKPPIECVDRDDFIAAGGDMRTRFGQYHLIADEKNVRLEGHDTWNCEKTFFQLPRKDFDALVRWYTGTEKQPRARKGTR